MGILRAGFPVFLISNRTSPAGLQHLISKSGVSHILTDEDAPQLKAKLEDVRKTDPSITVSYIPSWDQLISPELVVKKPQMVQPDLNDLCLVLHSSGMLVFHPMVIADREQALLRCPSSMLGPIV